MTMGNLHEEEGVTKNKRKAESAMCNAKRVLHKLCLCLKYCAVSALPAAVPPWVRDIKVSAVCRAQHHTASQKTAEKMT